MEMEPHVKNPLYSCWEVLMETISVYEMCFIFTCLYYITCACEYVLNAYIHYDYELFIAVCV